MCGLAGQDKIHQAAAKVNRRGEKQGYSKVILITHLPPTAANSPEELGWMSQVTAALGH